MGIYDTRTQNVYEQTGYPMPKKMARKKEYSEDRTRIAIKSISESGRQWNKSRQKMARKYHRARSRRPYRPVLLNF